MELSDRFAASSAVLDDAHLVSIAGLVPVLTPAARADRRSRQYRRPRHRALGRDEGPVWRRIRTLGDRLMVTLSSRTGERDALPPSRDCRTGSWNTNAAGVRLAGEGRSSGSRHSRIREGDSFSQSLRGGREGRG